MARGRTRTNHVVSQRRGPCLDQAARGTAVARSGRLRETTTPSQPGVIRLGLDRASQADRWGANRDGPTTRGRGDSNLKLTTPPPMRADDRRARHPATPLGPFYGVAVPSVTRTGRDTTTQATRADVSATRTTATHRRTAIGPDSESDFRKSRLGRQERRDRQTGRQCGESQRRPAPTPRRPRRVQANEPHRTTRRERREGVIEGRRLLRLVRSSGPPATVHLSPPPRLRLSRRVARARRYRASPSPPPRPRLSRRVARARRHCAPGLGCAGCSGRGFRCLP